MNTFVNNIESFGPISRSESAYDTLISEYERVIFNSLITSFGLDFILNDRYGGDVDTIHNVRKVGIDANMQYKDSANENAYINRGTYNYADYHKDARFTQKKANARQDYNERGTKIRDAYTGKDLEYTKASAVPKECRVELDHVVECKSIHDDRGRVLSGISGVDLANQNDNFAWTNKSLNASMGAWARGVNDKYKKEHGCDAPMEMVDVEAYIAAHPNLDEQTASNMLAQYRVSRKSYEQRISYAYYTSSSFMKATAKASACVGFKMGLRQALGLIFSEIWFAVRDELRYAKGKSQSFLKSIGNAIKRGYENAKKRYKDIWNQFITGTIAGVLSSLTTTICNIFFSTAKNVVRIIRQSWASLVEAVKILFFNPDCLPVGEKFRAATKVLATGASVVVGCLVGDLIHKTGVGAIPIVGNIVVTFCSTLVTGIMSCSLLYFLDHNSFINELVKLLNKIPSVSNYVIYFREQAALLDEYAAKLFNIDLARFKEETAIFINAMAKCISVTDPIVMNRFLKDIYFNKLKLKSPFGPHNDIDTFMMDKSAVLIF
jgi:hypothetical protein